MKTLCRSLIPKDFTYYRTWSQIFFEYYKKYTSLIIEQTGNWYEFLKANWLFFWFKSITVEKQDIEPTKEKLKKLWISHGIVFWTPMRVLKKPKGWWKIPTWFTKWDIHSSRSAFCVLDRKDYWNKWSGNARAHRKHVIENISLWKIYINENANLKEFLKLYKNTKINDPNKNFVYKMTKKLFLETKTSYQVIITYVENKPLAWAVFINQWITSEYFASFYHEDSKPYHLWIAIMDAWFSISYKKWMKYLDLDHMQDKNQLSWYAWYTKFKESIADFDVYFHDMWVKIF